MRKGILLGIIGLAAVIGLFAWHPWSRGSASLDNQAEAAGPPTVEGAPGFATKGKPRGMGQITEKLREGEEVVTFTENPFRYVYRALGGEGSLDYELTPQVYVEGAKGCVLKDGNVRECAPQWAGYADMYTHGMNRTAATPRTGGSSKWAAEGASVCEATEADGGVGGECYDSAEEICDGVSRKAIANASGTCPRQLRCCPDPNAVRERTEQDEEREERAPAKPAAKAKAKAGGDANAVPGDTGDAIRRGR